MGKAFDIGRPGPDEYGTYFGTYVGKVPEGPILEILAAQLAPVAARLRAIPASTTDAPTAPGKWSLKQVLNHVIDAERVFAYRALRIGRGDKTPLPGFEQDPWVETSQANARSWADHIAEFESVRAATVSLFAGFPREAWMYTGTASNTTLSVRAMAYIIAGHLIHHKL